MSINTIGKWLKTFIGPAGVTSAFGFYFLTDAQIVEAMGLAGAAYMFLDSIINGFQAWDKTRKKG